MTGRRIAAALLTLAISVGVTGITSGPAQAKDTSWPTVAHVE